ncbi:hypothetical protein WG66_010038 [Moniliophthora roreri]|uniref:Protein-S-isoprenylcysteine O-methyltransferase n=1 Tax=Moniliophthora roreri TaxID=221103 RepID=A0A0W0EYR9_MONRR|nr:hypothetical protein WG66_010038 [Moniliophthora roreri]
MTPNLKFLQAVLKAILVLLSGIAFRISFTPPNGRSVPPPRPPLSEGFFALREWLLMSVLVARIFPIEMPLYYIAAINEALFILSTPIPFIKGVLPHLDILTNTDNTQLTPRFIGSALLSIAGGVSRIVCYRTLGDAFIYDCARVEAHAVATNPGITNGPMLITHGPYSIVRHPSYVACWMAVIGSGLVHLIDGSWIKESGILNTLIGKALVYSWLGAFGVTLVLLALRVEPEDQLMKKQFGERWEQWNEKVRYKLIPWVY